MREEITQRIRVYGIVQGVGFRPTVYRYARRFGLKGSVCNRGPYVEIRIRGDAAAADEFLALLQKEPPSRAVILKIEVKRIGASECGESFEIVESAKTKGEIFVSPDIAICESCRNELFDRQDRRYLHPFINCTCCGPRLTILESLPYDRERTSMKEFPMCPDCAEEYGDPASRRYDAQPVCCHDCGPEVYWLEAGTCGRPADPSGAVKRGREAVLLARRFLREGRILAVKGIGGFHLCCDASNEEAVSRLRGRKGRPAKPFAVMVKDRETALRECRITPAQEAILDGPQKPIVLLPRREGGRVCAMVAPGNPKIGILLPYAPIHLLLFSYDDNLDMPDCLVMTSGNVSGAPICRDDEEALTELGSLCDGILSHDRKIRIRADDSVMDFFEGKPYMIRRSRGYAPLPFRVSAGWKGRVLAVGGELKNTFCIGTGDLFYPSPYLGDMGDVRTVTALKETVGRMEELLEAEPELVACDWHPGYQTTAAAREMGLPLFPVQHHYAHVLSCMAENDCLEPVIGVAFDGTGYGSDGTVWGGEILVADCEGFSRLGSIAPFAQPGGDSSVREGWRIAVSFLNALADSREEAKQIGVALGLCGEKAFSAQCALLDRGLNTVCSTSAGRLFDGVSAILGYRLFSTFEGEASCALEYGAEAFVRTGREPYRKEAALLAEDLDGRMILNTEKLVKMILDGRLAGEKPDRLAEFFHRELAKQIRAACVRASRKTGRRKVALSGGVFQNRLLLTYTVKELRENGLTVLLHSQVPANDGGLALGQATAAMYYQNGMRGPKSGEGKGV
ncbi:MAG: carbamoyltransferase HypF [Lachnospiraceae bacterium]|nr:carbamoyltransferase HypF [Lachnospiraceae bacterium]